MTANAMLGVIGTMIGGAACFCLGYHCALRWVAAELESMNRSENGNPQERAGRGGGEGGPVPEGDERPEVRETKMAASLHEQEYGRATKERWFQ